MKPLLWSFCLLAIPLLLLGSPDARADSLITEWNPIIIDAVVKNRPAPTPSTHVMSCIFSSAYDAWAAYDPVAEGAYTGNLFDATGTTADREEAISHAIFTVLNAFAPDMSADQRNDFMTSKGYLPSATTPAAVLGRTVAQSVIDYRKDDGSNQPNGYKDTTGYKPRDPSIPDSWQPLVVNGVTQTALTPHWRNVIPFAMKGSGQFLPPPPAAPSSERWNNQIQQLIDLSAHLTDTQKVIAEYWRPKRGTPPMLLAGLTGQVSHLKGFNLDQDVVIFFAIHNAMFDAGIACWTAKYEYDYVRPITAIRNLGSATITAWAGPNQGTQMIPASAWQPYQRQTDPTPPFPEFTSGHSTFSSSWAEIMRSFTESDYFGGSVQISDLEFETGHFDPPITLYWPSFTAAAEEAGISRLYGGIHFMDANRWGLSNGTLAGKTVWTKVQALVHGLGPSLSDPRCDINSDGVVNQTDLVLLMGDWHRSGN